MGKLDFYHEINFYNELNHYFKNNQECLIALNNELIYTECRIIKLDGESKKLQFTCNSDFLDMSGNRCELIIAFKDIKYIGRELPNLYDVEDSDYNDEDDKDCEESII